MIDPLLTVAEVAALLHVSPATVRALLDGGKLKCYRVGPKGGRHRVSREQVAAYLRSVEDAGRAPEVRTEPLKLKHLKLGA